MPVRGPGSEKEQYARAGRARDRVTLTRVEHHERAGAHGRACLAARHLDLAFDDREPRALAHLMVAEYLLGLETKKDRTGVTGVEHGWCPDALRRFNLEEIPRLHPVTVSR